MIYNAYLILLGAAVISNSVLIYILHRYSQHVLTIVSFIIFLFCINIWIIPFFIINLFHAQGLVFENLTRFAALGYVGTPVTFLIFSLAYTMNYKVLGKFYFWFFLLIPAVIFLYLSWASNDVSIHEFTKATLYPWGYENPIGKYFFLYLLWFETIMILSITFLVRYYRYTKEYIKKRQTLFVILSVLVPLIVGTFTNGILPMFNIYLLPAAVTLSSIMAPIVVFAIVRYGLFEVTPGTILESINHAIITVDNKGAILHMNTFSENILGVKVAQVIRTSVEEIFFVQSNPKNSRNHLMQLLKQVFNNHKIIKSDVHTILNKKGQRFPFTITITPVYSQEAVVGANIFLSDMSQEKAREKYKDDFINVISHELKIPLTSIKAYNQLLAKQLIGTNTNMHQYVLKIDEQLDRLVRLINDFFELSRVQTGKLKLKREIIRIDDLVHEVITTLKVTYKDYQISVEGNTNSVIFIDKDRITQVIINLVTNAIKYSSKNKKVVVGLTSNEKRVTVSVRDYGRGIPPEFHKKIFDQFYQVENTQKNAGLGIGLFIVSYMVKIHGGKVWVESTQGKGSTFYFSLPVSN